jgi:hypothetical protein
MWVKWPVIKHLATLNQGYNMPGIFVTATTAREKTRNNVLIHSEITSIENAVFAAIQQGVLSATVNDTTMTTDSTYYYAWNNVVPNPTKLDQLDFILRYFNNLGYSISLTPDAIAAKLRWNIFW